MPGLFMEFPENIHLSVGDPMIKPRPLDRQKSRDIFVLFGPGEIDLLMCGVIIAGDDDFFVFRLERPRELDRKSVV